MDDLDATLDDEVEKELRQFEQLRSGLLGISAKQQNVDTGEREESCTVGGGNVEQNNENGSDMEVDEDLEREIAEAKKMNPTRPLQKVERASNKPFLLVNFNSNIRNLPDTFAEENLLGDDLLEKTRITADGEEANLDLEQVQLFNDWPSNDPLNPNINKSIPMKGNQTLKSNPPQFEANRSSTKNQPTGFGQSKLTSRKRKTEEEEEEDPDFSCSSKHKSWSHGSTVNYKLLPYESPGTEHDGAQDHTSQKYNDLSLHNVPFLARKPWPPKIQLLGNYNEQSQRPMPPCKWIKSSPANPNQLRNIPSQMGQLPDTNTSSAIVNRRVQGKSFYNEIFRVRESILDNPKPSCSKDYQVATASAETLELNEGEMLNTVLKTDKAEVKIPGKIPQSVQRHVRAINFDQPTTRYNQNTHQTLAISHPTPTVQVTSNKTEQRIPLSGQPNILKPPKHPAYMEFLKNSRSLLNAAPFPRKQEVKEPSLKMLQVNESPTVSIIDITTASPVQCCVIEHVMQRRFERGFSLDVEQIELMEAGRPGILCPEMQQYIKFCENETWLAACNELKRFYCWPCLFFAIKVIWSVACDEHSEAIIGKEINKHKQSPIHLDSLKQHDARLLQKNCSIIKTLHSNNFVDGTWSDEKQEAIIMKGRPCPILDKLTNRKSKAEEKLAFEEFYRKVIWICGCTSSQKFYCWPCVLFCGTSPDEYTYSGIIESADAWIQKHEMCITHMDACLKLGRWKFGLKLKSQAKNEDLEKTRDFLKCLVEVLCAEKKKIYNSEFSTADCMDTLEIMCIYNKNLKTFMDEKSKNSKTTMAQTVGLYQPAILDSVEYFIKSEILDEIRNSNFISLIFDHSSGLSHKAVLSVIVRYLDGNGHVHERFVKLLNVGYNTPSNTLHDEFFHTIAQLQCRSKLVGFTYDGYLVKPEKIPEFNARVQKLCPNAKFFLYSEHNFNRVLKQALSHVPVCRSVFQVVKELSDFFENTPGARKSISDIVKSVGTSERDDFWRSPNFIRILFVYHAVILEIMRNIINNARDWRVKTVVQATNFLDFFNKTKNRFFITVIARLFHAVEDLTKALDEEVRNEDTKTTACSGVMKIQKIGRNFGNILDSACSHLESSDWEKTRRDMSIFCDQFTNVVQSVVGLIENRIIQQEPPYFTITKESPVSSSEFFLELKRQNVFLQNVALPSEFSSTRLLMEIEFFRDASILSGRDLPEIINLMNNYNMIEVLPEFFKFLQLALTIPKKAYDDSTIPAVRRISAYVEGKKDLYSPDALFWMEKELLTNLQKAKAFYGKVTDRVLSITKNDGSRK